MKTCNSIVALCMVLAAMTFSISCEAAVTVTLTAPTNNTLNITCYLPVRATITTNGEQFAADPIVRFTNPGTGAFYTRTLLGVPGEAGVYAASVYTVPFTNAGYNVRAEVAWRTTNYPPTNGTAVSPSVYISTLNGWRVIDDAAKTFAKVTAPADGALIGPNQNFTVSSDHKITWKRYEACGSYAVDYRYSQITSWTPEIGNENYTYRKYDGTFTLAQNTDEQGVAAPLGETYTMFGNFGQWVARADTFSRPGKDYVGDGRTFRVAQHGDINFSTVPAP